MREKLLHFPCVSRIHSTSERKNPPDFRREGAKCELYHISACISFIQDVEAVASVMVVRHDAIHSPLNAAAVFVVLVRHKRYALAFLKKGKNLKRDIDSPKVGILNRYLLLHIRNSKLLTFIGIF
ncbi:hypothetical protein ETC03_19910 [Geobacillus sp. MMMUD3]|nr:hypothetical protein [Geobacillus sp. MMMUD3]